MNVDALKQNQVGITLTNVYGNLLDIDYWHGFI